jgi:hypothetical protein
MSCEHCPVKGRDCYGTGPLPHLCEWAADPARAGAVVRRHDFPPPAVGVPAPTSPPPLVGRIANFLKAAGRHVAAGMPAASPELQAARLAVCDGCDQRLPGGTCAGCGCNLSIKSSWLGEVCPKGKWPTAPTGQSSGS